MNKHKMAQLPRPICLERFVTRRAAHDVRDIIDRLCPVWRFTVESNPPIMAEDRQRGVGEFGLFFDTSGTYDAIYDRQKLDQALSQAKLLVFAHGNQSHPLSQQWELRVQNFDKLQRYYPRNPNK